MNQELQEIELSTPKNNVYDGVHKALTVGMCFSTPIFVLGVALALWHPTGRMLTAPELKAYYNPAYLATRLMHLDANAVLLLATAAMILTPISRVVVSLVAFAVDGDRRFVLVTALVLLTIALAFVLGLCGVA